MDLKNYFNQLWNTFSATTTDEIKFKYDLDNIFDELTTCRNTYPYTVTTTTKVTHHCKSVIRDPARRWRKR